ncbi:HD-GYP domain-containing protein [Rhizobium sp. S152]|uniref:HD-GYP domain-containing protein n=1 Tax=Rhizobium sp. S152 TaxID=3055038 RepID=UPI0025A98B96|nr:HD-GYP domain-containing protein [Rhizobium sp. S152]MDM9629048.1 HD-GYP domain-containing protein [Rhizobium sp. S152]
MIKLILKSQLRTGMYVESIKGEWVNGGPAARRLLLKSDHEVARLKAGNFEGVFINTALGIDVANAVQAAVPTADLAAVEHAIKDAVRNLHIAFEGAIKAKSVSLGAFEPVVATLKTTVQRHPALLIGMTRLKSKDDVTFVHSVAVSALMMHFADALELDEATTKNLGIAGLLHDIGKLSIASEILNKAGTLGADERRVIQDHPIKGHEILRDAEGVPPVVLDICRHHHERLDGYGYPDRLSGEAISKFVRMSTICDVFDAVTSVRPYKKPWTTAQAIRWMLSADGVFDRKLLWAFACSLDLPSETVLAD